MNSKSNTIVKTMHARVMMKDLLDLEEGLTDWKLNFIESISHGKGILSDRQCDTIESIWHKLC